MIGQNRLANLTDREAMKMIGQNDRENDRQNDRRIMIGKSDLSYHSSPIILLIISSSLFIIT